uniref:Uncharacterized protein n=1 Tax=Meloidogyne enterolobii TaxID=390850 RepID=A0A6V7TV35_MELEN|nr:unnamed protein product [Meloidogyne enterolobii]
MNFFVLFPFLLINFCYFTNAEKASIEKCDSTMEADYEKDCKCLSTDFPTCLKALVAAGTCTKENYPTNPIERPCSKMYSKCSSRKMIVNLVSAHALMRLLIAWSKINVQQ